MTAQTDPQTDPQTFYADVPIAIAHQSRGRLADDERSQRTAELLAHANQCSADPQHSLLDAVLTDLLPALPDESRVALTEARPSIDSTAIAAS